MLNFIVIIFIVALICFFIKNKVEENEKENSRRQNEMEENLLKKNYPDGYYYYKFQKDLDHPGLGYSSRTSYRTPDQIIGLKSEIIKRQTKIDKERKEAAQKDEQFIIDQKKFVEDSIVKAKKCLPSFGRYNYSIPWEKRTQNGDRIKTDIIVWQFFPDSLCLDKSLDYNLCVSEKSNFDNLEEFKNKKRHWNDSVYENINCFLRELSKYNSLGILLNKSINGWDEDSISFHYKNISRNIENTKFVENDFVVDFNGHVYSRIPNDVKYLVVIDCYTENSQLVYNCKNILRQLNPPCIIYLSFLKCYDRKEMVDIIATREKEHKEKEEQAKLQEEKIQKARKQKKLEREYNLIKSIFPAGVEYYEKYLMPAEASLYEGIVYNKKTVIQYDVIYSEYLRLQKKYPRGIKEFEKRVSSDNGNSSKRISIEDIINHEDEISEHETEALKQEIFQQKKIYNELSAKVADWRTLQGEIHYNYLLNYYPTTCEFEADDKEWHDRWTVWNFKNTPGKIDEDDHNATINDVISRIKIILSTTFGETNLKYLTLVCVPASTAEKTESRYKVFSNILCHETGMLNAYEYMKVDKNSEEKKFGGDGIKIENVTFDDSFFKTRNVILFDDVITKGDSMIRFKNKLESLGSNVICGFSIGKTKHERVL